MKFFELSTENFGRPPRHKSNDLKLVRMPAHDVERLAPNRARAAQHGNALHAANACRYRTAMGAHNSRLSMRSSRPPWPGISTPESLTPVWRLINDSTRSPTMVAAAMARP